MGSYVNSILGRGETVQYEAKLHWIIFVPGILLLLVFGVGILLLIPAYINYRTSEFAVTNKRVILKTGFISRNAFDMLLDKVEGIAVDQSILGRMLNFGTITIRGTGGASQPFVQIQAPFVFKNMVYEASEARKGHGVF